MVAIARRLPIVARGASFRGPVLLRQRLKSLALVAFVLSLGGCAGGFDMKKAEVDPTILTSSVRTEAGSPADPERLSDETAIRNAVSSADLTELAGKSLPWANPATGSRGAISALVEAKDKGLLCRRFTTSRESFDGIALFTGEACMAETGAWHMAAFSPV